MEEKINVSCNRDGGLESMEVSGMLTLRISDEQLARVRLALHNPSKIPYANSKLSNEILIPSFDLARKHGDPSVQIQGWVDLDLIDCQAKGPLLTASL